MEEIEWMRDLSWASVAAIVAAAVFIAYMDARRRRKEARENHLRYGEKRMEWMKAVASGDTALVMRLKRELDEMAKLGWDKAVVVVAAALALSGCRTVETVDIPVGEHILHPKAGDVVPDLPSGESQWWLCTPTGMSLLLPANSPIMAK